MWGLTGTLRLIRLALRRDRIKLPAWILALTAIVAVNVPAVISVYGKSMSEQVTYAANMAPSIVGRIFGGPLDGPNIGSIVLNETYLFTAIGIAFMSILAVVRHTRQNEETGRSELIGSAIVGRNASLAAALAVTIGANVVLAAFLAAAYILGGLDTTGSIGTAVSLGLVGIAFAAVAAITAQIAESARTANGMAAAALGVFFLLRGAGDGLGHLTANKLGVVTAWPSWLSPLGWAQQVYPYTQRHWWVLGLLGGFIVAATSIAFFLNNHRDLGLGMIATRKGPAHAARTLLSPLGLARRLQRGVWIGWAISIAVMGVTIGLITEEFSSLYKDDPDMAQYLAQFASGSNFEDVFFAAMFAMMSLVIAGYAIQALQRLRSEEANGQLEPLLATAISRPRWMLSHIAYAYTGAVALLVILGLCAGITYVLVAGAHADDIWRLAGASLSYAPAVLVVAGFAAALFGFLPRAVIALSWSVFGILVLLSQFGALLKVPQFILNISPFTHLPAAPANAPKLLPLIILSAAALVLTAAGIAAFRRRDITTA